MTKSNFKLTTTFQSALFASTVLSGAVLAGPAFAGQPVVDRVQKLESTIVGLQHELDAIKRDQAAAAKQSASASNVVFKGGPSIEAADGSWSFKVRGRIEADAAFYGNKSGPIDYNDGTTLRRARVGVDGKIFNDWLYRLEADFATASIDTGSSEIDVKDAYIAYAGFDNTKITIGQHKTPNSLSQLTSSTDLLLTERPLAVEAFNHRVTAGGDYKPGISVGYSAKNFTVTGGVFGANFATTGFSGNDESWGPAARVTFAPINEKTAVLHLGASGYWRSAAGNGTVRFRSGPEVSTVDSNRLVDTGALSADNYASGGVELAGLYGPFYAQAEYLVASVNQKGSLPNLNFDGGYATVSYALTGESRGYKSGVFTRIKPKNPFSLKGGGLGAWEIAARYSTINLNDGAVHGGTQDNYEAGINWYPNEYIRFALDYVNFDANKAGVKNSGDAIVTRVGVSW